MSKNLDNIRKQLRFRAWHRGTREMDLILGSFADQHIPNMDEAALSEFAIILEISDPELYEWYLGKVSVPAEINTPLMQSYLKHRLAT